MQQVKSVNDRLFDVTQVTQSTQLKEMASRRDPEALRTAARQFEAFFLDTMTKSMRNASKGLGQVEWLHSNSTEYFQEMYDQQLSLNMVKGASFGIANLLEAQLSGKQNITRITDANKYISPPQTQAIEAIKASKPQMDAAIDKAFDDPVEFVKTLWADAVEVAEQLNVDPKLLIAQAALETGWGKSIISKGDNSSFNLFNIKADPSWNGDKVAKSTLEYEDGLAVKKNEPFRSYKSFSESFKDYFGFLNTNPRYSDALSMSYDPKQYLQSLQDAGYATDPNYANKVYQIYRGETLNNAISTMFTR